MCVCVCVHVTNFYSSLPSSSWCQTRTLVLTVLVRFLLVWPFSHLIGSHIPSSGTPLSFHSTEKKTRWNNNARKCEDILFKYKPAWKETPVHHWCPSCCFQVCERAAATSDQDRRAAIVSVPSDWSIPAALPSGAHTMSHGCRQTCLYCYKHHHHHHHDHHHHHQFSKMILGQNKTSCVTKCTDVTLGKKYYYIPKIAVLCINCFSGHSDSKRHCIKYKGEVESP